MDMIMRKIIFVIVALAAIAPASADTDGLKTAIGVGNGSCGKWTQDRAKRGPNFYLNVQWLAGYLSALNRWNVIAGEHDVLEHIDADAIVKWMDKYCSQHPLTNVVVAVGQLARELDKR
jgi:hypothetical protein